MASQQGERAAGRCDGDLETCGLQGAYVGVLLRARVGDAELYAAE